MVPFFSGKARILHGIARLFVRLSGIFGTNVAQSPGFSHFRAFSLPLAVSDLTTFKTPLSRKVPGFSRLAIATLYFQPLLARTPKVYQHAGGV